MSELAGRISDCCNGLIPPLASSSVNSLVAGIDANPSLSNVFLVATLRCVELLVLEGVVGASDTHLAWLVVNEAGFAAASIIKQPYALQPITPFSSSNCGASISAIVCYLDLPRQKFTCHWAV